MPHVIYKDKLYIEKLTIGKKYVLWSSRITLDHPYELNENFAGVDIGSRGGGGFGGRS